ncbi:MAG: DUF2066 domain-containing protein [Magnetococcales bacterium]|nr:DUF2066 domain-containing protein [Magnetococcales bacterium]
MTDRRLKLMLWLGHGCPKIVVPLVLLAYLLFPTWTQATTSADFFIVKKVAIRVPRSNNSGTNENATGLLQAQQIAFKRLIQRMLTIEERKTRIVFLKDIQHDIKDLLQRSIIVSEKQRTRDIDMTIDIHFSKEKVVRSLELAGINFCETPYPMTLLVIEDGDSFQWLSESLFGAFGHAANVYGFEVIQPIKDMEDLSNFSRMKDSKHRNEVQDWAQNRYKADKIWQLSVGGDDVSEAKDNPIQTDLRFKLTEIGDDGVVYHFAKLSVDGTESKGKSKTTRLESSVSALVSRVVDPWISSHLMMGGLGNFLDVSIVNSDNLDLMDALIKKMELFPGVEKVSYLEMSSNKVTLRIQYTGNELDIQDGLKNLGAIDQGQGQELLIMLP